MSELVTLHKAAEFAVIEINNPPVNALSPRVTAGISRAIAAIQSDEAVQGAILMGSGKTFIAGADLKEFRNLNSFASQADDLLQLALEIENCAKPVVAALHGTVLGAGLVVALACHYRVALPSTQFGFPEVNLGLIPAAGGTQLLPRLIGVAKAIEMCAFGVVIDAEEGRACKLIDQFAQPALLSGAMEFLREKRTDKKHPKTSQRTLDSNEDTAAIIATAREKAGANQLRNTALTAIEALEAATSLPFEAGCQKEVVLFHQCLFSDEAHTRIEAFFRKRGR